MLASINGQTVPRYSLYSGKWVQRSGISWHEFCCSINSDCDASSPNSSGHDITLTLLLHAFGVSDGSWPGYASFIQFELYKNSSGNNREIPSLPLCKMKKKKKKERKEKKKNTRTDWLTAVGWAKATGLCRCSMRAKCCTSLAVRDRITVHLRSSRSWRRYRSPLIGEASVRWPILWPQSQTPQGSFVESPQSSIMIVVIWDILFKQCHHLFCCCSQQFLNSLTFSFVLHLNVPIINKLMRNWKFVWNVNCCWELRSLLTKCVCEHCFLPLQQQAQSQKIKQKTLCWAMIKFLDPHFHYWDLVPERNGGAHNAAYLGSVCCSLAIPIMSYTDLDWLIARLMMAQVALDLAFPLIWVSTTMRTWKMWAPN